MNQNPLSELVHVELGNDEFVWVKKTSRLGRAFLDRDSNPPRWEKMLGEWRAQREIIRLSHDRVLQADALTRYAEKTGRVLRWWSVP